MMFLFIITVFAFGMAVRAFLVLIGTYKDPVFTSFEDYGEERIFSPMFSFVSWGGFFAYIMLFWYLNPGVAFSLGLIIVLPLTATRATFLDMLYKYHESFRIFPLWYYRLVQRTDRQERRRLAYLWLRLPLKTRMIYNTHTILCEQWVEQVLVTISR